MNRRHALLSLASLLSLACQTRSKSPTERPLRIAAAADVEPVFTSLAEEYRKKFGREVVLSFAASGALAKQIEHGAPFDLFVSASEAHIERLRSKGRLRPDSIRRYARGQLTIWTAGDGPLPQSLTELASRTSLRIALANPEHAPYGQAAVAALRQAGVYDAVSRRLVFAENVRQAQQFAESGNTDVAIIARSLAGRSGRFVEIPLSLHPPIVQSLAVISEGDERAATDFTAMLFDPPGRLLLRDSGFLPPE
jgi:molybdate transport system substrate-binding protein